jgi:hypothetical protein
MSSSCPLGAFILAVTRFTQKQLGFTLCNVSGGTITTEVAGWSSGWLKAQDFHQIYHWTALVVGVPRDLRA